MIKKKIKPINQNYRKKYKAKHEVKKCQSLKEVKQKTI